MTEDFIATCWTSAGNVAPLDPDERSPLGILDRVRAVAAAGWAGIGISQDDLRHVQQTLGFAQLRAAIVEQGLRFTEVELLTDWWETGERRERSDAVRDTLFAAAHELAAVHIKIATAFGQPLSSIAPLVDPLGELAQDAAASGIRLAFEPMPFSMINTVPMAADLVRAVGQPNCGVLIDSWHVFRAGTSLDDLRATLSGDIVFGVELDDADEAVVGTLFEDTINERRLCGEGSFDLPRLVSTVRDLGYRGPWGVEIISREHRARSLDDGLSLALETAKDVVGRCAPEANA